MGQQVATEYDDYARTELSRRPELGGRRRGRVAIVDEGKHADAVRQALREIGTRFAASTQDADVLVIGTLSPGPMMDAWERRRGESRPVVRPWTPSRQDVPAPVATAG